VKTDINVLYDGDCYDIMKTMPDKYIDLTLTDPPYGIFNKNVTGFKKGEHEQAKKWDQKIEKKYFDEIKRISKNYIIWGGNYYASEIGYCKEPLIWDKVTGDNYFADGELAFTSFGGTLRIFKHQWCGAFKDSERRTKSIHPTQKPVELFSMCLEKYSKENDLIFDPFAGSGTTAISCINMNRRYILVEKEIKYIKLARKRIDDCLDGNLLQWVE
jgi:site-specific DNA-methyltransferase (adenine-specific)